MARRLVISDGELAQEVAVYKIAVGGVVKSITRAACVYQGIVRQYWPPSGSSPEPPQIVWNTDPISVNEVEVTPTDSIAFIEFNRNAGLLFYNNYPDADVSDVYMNPALRGIPADDGKYIIKASQSSGAAITGTLDTWIDLNSASLFTWSLDQTSVGSSSAIATISIAKDNGAGAPLIFTQIDKQVSFGSEVRLSGSKIVWSAAQRDLVEVTVTVDADCSITFAPQGFATGAADTSGAFNENWHEDSPSVLDPENYTVSASLVSGTAPTGPALDTAHTLDVTREWILATTGEASLTCEVDYTIDDGVAPSTKRITMLSQRSNIPDVNWTGEWACTDAGFPQAVSGSVFVYLTYFADGSATLEMETLEMPRTTFETGTWFDGTPSDGNDYECTAISGNGINVVVGSPGTSGEYVRMTEDREWVLETATLSALRIRDFIGNARTVGGLAQTKTINVTVVAASGDQPV